MQPGAFDMSHTSMDCCIQFSEEGPYTFDPMDPLFPGDVYLLEISYKAEAKVPTQVIEKKIVYDTEALYFLVQKVPKFTAESLEGLELLSVETYDGIQYYNFKGSELKAGDVVRLRLKTELTVLDVLSGNPLIWGSLLLLIPAGVVVYVVAFRKTKGDLMENLEQKKRELFSGLAEAEKNFNEGKITRDEFEKLQKEFKERSIQVLKEINKRKPGKKAHVINKTSVDERSETMDLLSELKAVDSVLRELRSDYEGGAITEDSYKRISARYHERRSRIEEQLRIAGVRDDREAQEE
jgi:F0F1-type ATP synthase membrane subunit b/b'